MRHYITVIGMSALLAACTSWDMQGHNPVEYYAANPVVNAVESRSVSHVVHFAPKALALSTAEKSELRAALSDAAPEASEMVQVNIAARGKRSEHLLALLRHWGYGRAQILVEPTKDLEPNEARVDVTYAAVVSPRCPDWRKSPVTSYSNHEGANFGCAFVTNLGRQVADPRDLVRGKSGYGPDSERSGRVIMEYRTGKSASEDTQQADEQSSSAAAAEPAR